MPRNKYHLPAKYAYETPRYSDESTAKIEKKFSQEVIDFLASKGINLLGIFETAYEILEEERLENVRLAKDKELQETINQLDALINSIKPKKYSQYFPDLKSHKLEFLTVLARSLSKKEITIDALILEFTKFWTHEYSLMDIFSGLGYGYKDCLLKFIGVQNDGVLQITREMKYIGELVTFLKEGKIQRVQDIEDCYFWCQKTFSGAAKSYQIVLKWFSKFSESATRVNGRLVLEVKEKISDNPEDFLR